MYEVCKLNNSDLRFLIEQNGENYDEDYYCQIFDDIVCGMTIKKDNVLAGVAYISFIKGKLFLNGYKNKLVKSPIRDSIFFGKLMCSIVERAGYECVWCIFAKNRFIELLVKKIGFKFINNKIGFLLYKKQLGV